MKRTLVVTLAARICVLLMLVALVGACQRRDETTSHPGERTAADASSPWQRPPEPEALIVSFPPLGELEGLWEVDPKAFPRYAEVRVRFVQGGQAREETIGLNLPDIEQATLHRTPGQPVVAKLAEDQCKLGIAHLSVWVLGEEDGEPVFDLLAYESVPEEGDDSKPYLTYRLENPQRYAGPVTLMLTPQVLAPLLERPGMFLGSPPVAVNRDQPMDPKLVEQQLLARYELIPGEAKVIPLTLSPDVRLVAAPAKAAANTVVYSPGKSPLAMFSPTQANDLLVVARQPGTMVMEFAAPGTPPAKVELVIAGKAQDAGAHGPRAGATRTVVVADWDRLPAGVPAGVLTVSARPKAPATVQVPRENGEVEWWSVYPTRGAGGLSVRRTAMMPQPVVGIATSGESLLVATAREVSSLPPNAWTLPMEQTVQRIAASAVHLAVLTAPGRDAQEQNEPAVLLYDLSTAGRPKVAGVFNTLPWPVMMAWHGGELWVMHLDGRLLQATVRGGEVLTRLVQPEPRKDPAMDMVSGPGGRMVVGGGYFLDVYEGRGTRATLAEHHDVDCFVVRVMPAGGNRFMLGCAGVKVVGEKHGIKEIRPVGNASLLEVDLGVSPPTQRSIPFKDRPGAVVVLAPWPGGYLVGTTADESEQQPMDLTVVEGSSGKVLHRVPVPAAITSPGVNVVAWDGGVYPLLNGRELLQLVP